MWLFFTKADEAFIGHSGLTYPPGKEVGHPEYERARKVVVGNYNRANDAALQIGDVFGVAATTKELAENVQKANQRGQVVSLQSGQVVVLDEEPLPKIYLHIKITGGDGLSPVGILNDNTTGANVTIALREGPEPDSPLFNVAGNLINITWRVPIMRGDRQIWAKVQFVDSVATGVYRTSGEPGLLQLAPERLDPVTLPDGQGGYKTYGFAAGEGSDTEIIVSEELAAV